MRCRVSFGNLSKLRIVAAVMACVTALPLPLMAQQEREISWQHDVAPLIQTYCSGCHNKVEAAAELSLQSPAELLAGSEQGPVLDRTNPADSLLARVLTANDESRMPPAEEPQPTAAERELILKWILAGGEFDVTGPAMLNLPEFPAAADKVILPVLAVHPLSDGLLATAVFGKVQLRNAESLEVVRDIELGKQKVLDVQYLADRDELLVAVGTPGLNGRAIICGAADGEIVREFEAHGDLVYVARSSPDGRLVATAGYDRVIQIQNRATGEVLQRLKGHNGAVFDLAFNMDGTVLASASADATVKVWQVNSGQRLDTLSQPLSEQYAVVFSEDGDYLFAAGADHRIRKYQCLSRDALAINPLLMSRFAHESAINHLIRSPDGRLLATASDDQSIKIWDIDQVRQLRQLKMAGLNISCIAFSADSRSVLVGTSTGELRRLPLGDLATDVAVGGEVTQTDWTASVPEHWHTDRMPASVTESEPNDAAGEAMKIPFPAAVSGVIDAAGTKASDLDSFVFAAEQGRVVCVEVNAARSKSPLDSFVEVVNLDGEPILRAQLQAQRDSWFTFRGKDANTSDDFRLFNWREMELNEFLYSDGEVVRLWMYPRGPDSGFKVYPGFGSRFTWFGTTPTAHALQAPAFIVKPFTPDARIVENGLPVFPVYYQNDDDPIRQWGSDSRLLFTPPQSGQYIVRVRDARGFSGPDHSYVLTVRDAQPDFRVTLAGAKQTIPRGTGRELVFTADRRDGYSGPIEIVAESVPEGLVLSEPITIEAEQLKGSATLFALPDAADPTQDQVQRMKFRASAVIHGRQVTHDAGAMTEIKVADAPKLTFRIAAEPPVGAEQVSHAAELTVHPGETLRAWVQIDRHAHDGAVSFGKEDSGRNLPHGVFVDNIGLNGLLLPAGQTLREVFITAAPGVSETTRPFYLRAEVDGGLTSLPVMLHVRHRAGDSIASQSAGE